jgi:hypothetical protein
MPAGSQVSHGLLPWGAAGTGYQPDLLGMTDRVFKLRRGVPLAKLVFYVFQRVKMVLLWRLSAGVFGARVDGAVRLQFFFGGANSCSGHTCCLFCS